MPHLLVISHFGCPRRQPICRFALCALANLQVFAPLLLPLTPHNFARRGLEPPSASATPGRAALLEVPLALPYRNYPGGEGQLLPCVRDRVFLGVRGLPLACCSQSGESRLPAHHTVLSSHSYSLCVCPPHRYTNE